MHGALSYCRLKIVKTVQGLLIWSLLSLFIFIVKFLTHFNKCVYVSFQVDTLFTVALCLICSGQKKSFIFSLVASCVFYFWSRVPELLSDYHPEEQRTAFSYPPLHLSERSRTPSPTYTTLPHSDSTIFSHSSLYRRKWNYSSIKFWAWRGEVVHFEYNYSAPLILFVISPSCT